MTYFQQNFKKKLMNMVLRNFTQTDHEDLQVRIKREANKVTRHSEESFLPSRDCLGRFCEGVIMESILER